jgi:cysteine synthase
MTALGLEREIVDRKTYQRTIERFRQAKIPLPTLTQLADPHTIPQSILSALRGVEPNEANPLNLFRVHWYNDHTGKGLAKVPLHLVLPTSLTGVKAKIIVALGDRFPMIGAHKVLAAYGCLAPRVITGQFDPTRHKALWPSTGNYCRGGVAISRIMGCRGVAILPEGMSAERFRWLESWVSDQADIVRTPGSESNVKEIYDKCAELDREPQNVIFNQFCEFGNHLVHYLCTGRALSHIFETYRAQNSRLVLRAFVSATGSAGTIAAGDQLKDLYGTKIVALEAQECPTLLYNGFGEHNIQGIGDKHIPFIHNVMNTDIIAAVSDLATDSLGLMFDTAVGCKYLTERRGIDPGVVADLPHVGLSGIGNILGAIKTAKHLDLGPDDAIITVATDGAAMYASEREKVLHSGFAGRFDEITAGEVYGRHILGQGVDHLEELSTTARRRVFNLGYFTWVEQQGVSIGDFRARTEQSYWRGLRDLIPAWDEMINSFNAETGVITSR